MGGAVHLEVHGRPSDNGRAVDTADQVNVSGRRVDLAGYAGAPQMGLRPPGLPAVLQLVGPFPVSAECLFKNILVFSVPVQELLAGRHLVGIHGRDAVPVLVLYGVKVADHQGICLAEGSLLFSEVVLCVGFAEVPQILGLQLLACRSGHLGPAGAF